MSVSSARLARTNASTWVNTALALKPEGETFLGYCQRFTGTLEELQGGFAARSARPAAWCGWRPAP